MTEPTSDDPPAQPHDDGHLRRSAPEDELLSLEQAYRDLKDRRMRPVPVQAPPSEPELGTGDLS